MKIVLDCNVIIASALTNGLCRQVVLTVLEQHELIISQGIVEEYSRVSKREKFKKFWPDLEELIVVLCEIATLVPPSKTLYGLLDRDDEVYLQTAEAGKAHYLITGNHKHFPLSAYGEIGILSPKEFLEALA